MGGSSLVGSDNQQKLSLAAAAFGHSRVCSPAYGKSEACQRVPTCQSGRLRHWRASVRTASSGWALVLLSPRAQSCPGTLLGTASFPSTSWPLPIPGTGSRCRLLPFFPRGLGDSMRGRSVGVSPNPDPDCFAFVDDHRLYAYYRLALLQRCLGRHRYCRHFAGDCQELFRVVQVQTHCHESITLAFELLHRKQQSLTKRPAK